MLSWFLGNKDKEQMPYVSDSAVPPALAASREEPPQASSPKPEVASQGTAESERGEYKGAVGYVQPTSGVGPSGYTTLPSHP
ncbi:hypothetical protein WJX84_003343, partial [Apatococcus fuscideae]